MGNLFAYMITHHRWVFCVFLLMPLSVMFGKCLGVGGGGHATASFAARLALTHSLPSFHRTADIFLYIRNQIQFYLRSRAPKQHAAKVEEIKKQVSGWVVGCVWMDA